MSQVFSIPGKTFLAGEYLALEGGTALLGLTSPRFELSVQKGSGNFKGFHAESPAAKFLARESVFFRDLDIEFRDPYLGAGGWGASTAQYLGVFAAKASLGGMDEEALQELETRELLDHYLKDAWDGTGYAPSGADLIGQYKGGFTFFERKSGAISRHVWPFQNCEGFLLRTGIKVPTHEHLKTLDVIDTAPMAALMLQVKEAWIQGNTDSFTDAICEYGRVLQAQKLVAATTLSLLHDLLWLDGVMAAKGCGALGADIVFVVVRSEFRRQFERWCEEREQVFTSLNDSVTGGLKVRTQESRARDLENG